MNENKERDPRTDSKWPKIHFRKPIGIVGVFANVMALIVLAEPASSTQNCIIHNGIETLFYVIYTPLYLSLSLNMRKNLKVLIAFVALILTGLSDAFVPILPYCMHISTTLDDVVRDRYFGLAFFCYFWLTAVTLYEIGTTSNEGSQDKTTAE
jgi:hypothetical protein